MPKPARGGQRQRWTQMPPPLQPQPQPQQQDEDEEDDEPPFDITPDDVKGAPTQDDLVDQEAQLDHDDIDWDSRQFPYLTQQECTQIYQDNHDSYYHNGNIINAKKMYESQSVKPNTQGYSYSQDMNHRLNHDLPLDSDAKFMTKYLTMGLHPIGRDCTLVRGAHDTLVHQLLRKCGITKTYDQLTQSQLRSALVGTQYQMKSFGSFGANNQNNPFIGGSQGGGREVIIYARTASSTKVIAGARAQQEFITGIGQNARITDVKVTSGTAFTRMNGSKKVIELYIDQW